MSRRRRDGNGWYEIDRNPISRVGVYPYIGRQLGKTGEDANKVFQVYRPASELSDPEAMDSFRLVPFVDGHTMLGEGPNCIPAEDKGIHGVFGDRVGFDPDDGDGLLYSNLKVYSKKLGQKIDAGQREVSAGYRCVYDFTPGTFKGKAYDAVQRRLRGNHVASVPEGRMGPTVAVLDQMVFTVDAKDLTPMRKSPATIAAEKALKLAQDAGDAAMIAACDEAFKACTAQDAADEAAEKEAKEAKDKADKEAADAATAKEAKDKADKEAADKAAQDAADAILKAAGGETAVALAAAQRQLGVMDEQLKAANAEIEKLKATPAMDAKTLFGEIASRDALVKRLTPHIGVFDAADKTLSDVVAYGVEKLGLKNVTAGHEATALDAYLTAKPVPTPATVAQDARSLPKESAVSKYLADVD